MNLKFFCFYFIFLSGLGITSIARARILLTANTLERTNTTFSVPMHSFCVDAWQNLYLGASKEGAQEFAVTTLENLSTTLVGKASKTITLNGALEQPNPLYNAAISYLAKIDPTHLALVLKNNAPYVLRLETPGSLFSFDPLLDAQGKPTNGIIGVEGGNSMAFIALKGHTQDHFGTIGGGIAVIKYDYQAILEDISEEELKKVVEEAKKLSEKEAQKLLQSIVIDETKKTKQKRIETKTYKQIIQDQGAYPLSCNSELFKIGNDLESMDDTIAMHWSPTLERLYIGISGKTGSSKNAGALAIAVAHSDKNGRLTMVPFVDHQLLSDLATPILGAIKPNESFAIHHLHTLQTSTGFLDYLIVNGGHGTTQPTKQMVYALPLLNYRNTNGVIPPEKETVHGTLAAYQSSMFHAFSDAPHSPLFLGRHFIQAPKAYTDICPHNTRALYVGTGTCPGAISHLVVKDDAVYVAVNEPNNSSINGIYHSQAIFDYDGRILDWTSWKKIAETEDTVTAFLQDRLNSTITLLNGPALHEINRIEKTQWNSAEEPEGAKLITKQVPQTIGIQDYIYFDCNNPGVRNPFYCSLEYDRLKIIQPHNNNNTRIYKSPLNREDANCTTIDTACFEHIAPLTCAQIARNKFYAYLFIGGNDGLAVLCTQEGNGWPLRSTAGPLEQLPVEEFKCIGNFKYIRKLIGDEHFLYVLTDEYLDRIDIQKSNFSTNQLSITRLADAKHLANNSQYALFYDAIISAHFAAIGTSHGLFCTSEISDVRTSLVSALEWKHVAVPMACGPIVALMAIHSGSRAQDLACYPAAQLFAVSACQSTDQARIHRFVLYGQGAKENIKPLHDYNQKDSIGFFVKLPGFTKHFATDGSIYLTAFNKEKPSLVSGFGKLKTILPIDLPQGATINRIACNAQNQWAIISNLGIILNN